ncbi:hypothetical protein JMJ77_0006970, partial [Colletotrichum scovillei]
TSLKAVTAWLHPLQRGLPARSTAALHASGEAKLHFRSLPFHVQ